jgi:hypothetical protein
MKITAIDTATKKPVTNTTLTLQIRNGQQQGQQAGGKTAGSQLSVKTGPDGTFTLDNKLQGAQIAPTMNGQQGQWVTASEGATLSVSGGMGGTRQ